MEISDGYMLILISNYIKRFLWFKSQHIWTLYVVCHCVFWWQMLSLYLGLITMQQAALKQIQLDHSNKIAQSKFK